MEHARAGFRIDLQLLLPRDRASIPVTRHLTRLTLQEVGVVRRDVEDVELAISEATANAIEHAGDGDGYEVHVSIERDQCHIRVVDTGLGMLPADLPKRMAPRDALHGRGVPLMRALVDRVHYEAEPERGTLVHLVKHLRYTDDAPARTLLR